MVDKVLVQAVAKQIHHVDLLRDISFTVPQGTLCCITGVSGAGKSTLLHLLAGLFATDEGTIEFAVGDKLLDARHRTAQKGIGLVRQEISFYEELTVFENLSYFASLYRVPRKHKQQAIENVLSVVGLQSFHQHPAHRLSAGERKRLDFACSLVHDPQVLLLDEPFAHLDSLLRKQLLQLLLRLKDQGKTIIISSHTLGEIAHYSDTIGILHQGKLVEYAHVKQLLKKYPIHTTLYIDLHEADKQTMLSAIAKDKRMQIVHIDDTEQGIEITTKNPAQTLACISQALKKKKVDVHNIQVHDETYTVLFEHIVSAHDNKNN